MRLCTGQHKETKRLHCLQGPLIHYEKDKDISPSARDPLLPNKQFSCWNYSSCSNLFIVRDRMTSSTLQNTKSTRCFQEIRHQKSQLDTTWYILQQCNTTFTNCPRICGDFHYSDIALLLWKSKKYPGQGFDSHCPKTHTQIIFPKEFWSKLQWENNWYWQN